MALRHCVARAEYGGHDGSLAQRSRALLRARVEYLTDGTRTRAIRGCTSDFVGAGDRGAGPGEIDRQLQ